jgi:hypothetical protein
MTRGAAISIVLLAVIALALTMLLAWPTHSARSRETGALPTRSGSTARVAGNSSPPQT